MTHPLDEAIAEAQRMLSNARFVGAIMPLDFGGHPMPDPGKEKRQTEQAAIVEKWTRIEKVLTDAREAKSAEDERQRIGDELKRERKMYEMTARFAPDPELIALRIEALDRYIALVEGKSLIDPDE